MELYYVMTIVNRSRGEALTAIMNELGFSFVIANLGVGTAKSEHLLLYDLEQSEKVIFTTVATRPSLQKLFIYAENKLSIDIPGNGIMLAIPLKSVGGGSNLAYLIKGQEQTGGKPSMEFKHELIIIILNEGHSDSVMDAARKAGAVGGTVVHAKGTGSEEVSTFLGVSIAKNKDMIYIVAPASDKAAIMKQISEDCGKGTPAEAIAFSLPVSAVAGIREMPTTFLSDK